MFPTKAAKRLVSLPLRAGSSIKRRLSANDGQAADPSDKILAEFEVSVAGFSRAADRYRRAKSNLDRSSGARQGVVTSCEEIVDQTIKKLGADQEEESSDEPLPSAEV